jgi:hypothetical protein
MLGLMFADSEIKSAKELEVKQVYGTWLDEWIAQRHYLGYAPAGARLRLAVYHNGRCVGGMLWDRPIARHIDQWTVLELTRMYLLDECPRNSESRCLGLATRMIRRLFPEVRQLIAYSDPSYGHQGTIYKAAGWVFDGVTVGKEWTPRNGVLRRNKATGPKLRWVKVLGASE